MVVIAKNTEDYISFSIKVEVDKYVDKEGNERTKKMELRFIDSIKFMSSSLDSLVNNSAGGGGEFWGFENYNCSKRELLIRKGIYPYEYMDSWDKFKETSLPRKEKFYTNLNMSGVSDEDYKRACSVWREFGIRNMGEYHDLCLRTDVVLIANVFKSFRRVYLENYGLDPSHFYTAPGLAWKACLKKTGIRLELLLDPNMLLMLREESEVELPNLFTDRLLQTIPTWFLSMIKVNQLSTYNIWTQTTYMSGRCLNHCQLWDFTGLNLMKVRLKNDNRRII